MKRIFLIVLDSFGVGAEPDAADFGDVGSNTLRSCSTSKLFAMPNMIAAGFGNLDGVDFLPKAEHPTAPSRGCRSSPAARTPPSGTGKFPASSRRSRCPPTRTASRKRC